MTAIGFPKCNLKGIDRLAAIHVKKNRYVYKISKSSVEDQII